MTAKELRKIACFPAGNVSADMIPAFLQPVKYRYAVCGSQQPDSLGVLAFNMERGVHLAQQLDFIRFHPALEQVDLILASELDDGCFRSGNRNVPQEIARALGMDAVFGLEFIELADDRNSKGFHGNGIFSRWPILDAKILRLPMEYDWYRDVQIRIGGRLALIALLDVAGKQIVAVSMHLENRTEPKGRARQMSPILDYLQKHYPGIPAIMGGDLNTQCFHGNDLDLMEHMVADPAFASGFGDLMEQEPCLRYATEHGFSVVPDLSDTTLFTRRKILPSKKILSLRVDWLLMRGITPTDCRVLSTLRQDLDFLPPCSALSSLEGAELTDHNAVFAKCRISDSMTVGY